VPSSVYDTARHITSALNNMTLRNPMSLENTDEQPSAADVSRPSTSTASVSSIFDQPREETLTLLRAPKDRGGPSKLADSQIEITKAWLKQAHIENFCPGEERIHRFCMEVKLVSQQLVGETISNSPVLWSSELFTREKHRYEIHAEPFFGVSASSRAPSVMSEPSVSYPLRSTFAGTRGSVYSGSSRIGRGHIGSDIASYISSHGRSTTATTTESSSMWSPSLAGTNRTATTSYSAPSRTTSIHESTSLLRRDDHSEERSAFLEKLRQDLIALLLSDLGCPVWSCGSESDAWIDTILGNSEICNRMKQRLVVAQMLTKRLRPTTTPPPTKSSKSRKPRSQSADPVQISNAQQKRESSSMEALLFGSPSPQTGGFDYLAAFNDVLSCIRDHTDPLSKLQAIRDFNKLALDFQHLLHGYSDESNEALLTETLSHDEAWRRRSLDLRKLSINAGREQKQSRVMRVDVDPTSKETPFVRYLKHLLSLLRPKTIFRDLQYIAAFVTSNTMDAAFVDVGMAALSWKDEVCKAMVDVADSIVARDSIKRNVSRSGGKEVSVLKAMEYWIFGAREGNAIAQRELASLYLTHPDVPPVASLPLALSSEIFLNEMMWTGGKEVKRCDPALCLALHWMQQAAKNGDAVAQRKLKEREEEHSIR
jgi:hypothetical protein